MQLVKMSSKVYFVFKNDKMMAEIVMDKDDRYIYMFQIETRYRGRGYLRKIHEFIKPKGLDFARNSDSVVSEKMFNYLTKEGYAPVHSKGKMLP